MKAVDMWYLTSDNPEGFWVD